MNGKLISRTFQDETVVLSDYAGYRFVDCCFIGCRIEGPGTLEMSPPRKGEAFGYRHDQEPIIPVRDSSFIGCQFYGVTFDPKTWDSTFEGGLSSPPH